MSAGIKRFGLAATAALVLAGISGNAQLRHERAPFWVVPANDYDKDDAAPPQFPETSLLPTDRDIGVAFAGGGVRSASATIGELRGLEQAGLLPRVRYVSAVSGGAWAVIPWTFSGRPDLLGTYERPESLQAERVKAVLNGSLSEAVQGVSIELEGMREGGLIAWALQVPPESQDLLKVFRRLLKGARSRDRTYASMLRNSLLAPLGSSGGGDFHLDESHDGEYVFWNGPRPVATAQPQPGRPFMIVNANVVNAGADFRYPYAIPFEFTPLYVGSRQSVGGVFGGVYTWPSAYNATTARVVWRRSADASFSEYCSHAPAMGGPDHAAACARSQALARAQEYSGVLEYSHDEAHARVTLPDVAASTGAAPLFFIAGGNGLALDVRNFIRTAGGGFFPQFTHMALRDGEIVKPRLKWPHADGGARDNLGIAALLARQVKKIIVFANVSSENFNDNDVIASLFEPRPGTTSADKRENVMFETGGAGEEHPLAGLRAAFASKRSEGKPLVACGRYDVKANRTFNIRAYRDVRVCWVYPERAATWMELLRDDVRAIVDGRCGDCGKFENFPYFDTFGQNRSIRQLRNIGVLRLSTPQVNLMTNLMAWTVATAADEIRRGLDGEPPAPAATRQPTGSTAVVLDIPFEFRTRQPIVPVTLNGGTPAPFVVDTGASIHLVDREVARQAQIGNGRDVPIRGGGEAAVATQWVGGVTFAFGGRSWPAQRAAIAPLGYPDRKHFAGLIGAPILMQYAVRFDFPAQRLQLLDPAAFEPTAGALRVPFELQDDLPVVRVTIDAGGKPVIARLMVDTGASTSIDLNRPFVERHGLLQALPGAAAADRPAAIGGTAPFLYATGRRASIEGESVDAAGRRTAGRVLFDQPRLGLSRAQAGSSASDARDGVIGNELLRRYVMTVDYRRRTLVLAPS